MNIVNKVYSIIKIQLGDDPAYKFSVDMSTTGIATLLDQDQMIQLNSYFRQMLERSGKLDKREVFRYIDIGVEEMSEERWLNGIGFRVIPFMRDNEVVL